MAEDVEKYIKGCLMCQRLHVHRTMGMSSVLEKPMPMMMVSLDYVGPREWLGDVWYYLVIIDHHSRYMMTFPTKARSAAFYGSTPMAGFRSS